MHLVLCYDVVSDNRRNNLHKRLKGFLRPVQKSVFEGHLPPRRYQPLVRMVMSTIEPTIDTVRIYHLCKACCGRMDLLGTAQAIPTEDHDVVI